MVGQDIRLFRNHVRSAEGIRSLGCNKHAGGMAIFASIHARKFPRILPVEFSDVCIDSIRMRVDELCDAIRTLQRNAIQDRADLHR